MAALIEQAHGVSTELVVGNRGEFTVWVGDDCVARKDLNGFPAEDAVVSAVGQQL